MNAVKAMKRRDAAVPAGQPARERIYHYVREQILRGHFAGGSFIEEEQISSAMGVSRTPVREAFHRLEAERFIDLLPRRGALVRQVTAQELAHLYETRRMIEGYAVAMICQRKIPVPSEMATILDRMDEIADSDYFARGELNRLFHFKMVAALGNDVLAELYRSLDSRQQRVGITALRADPNRIPRIQAEHRALLAALQAGDEAQARAVLEQHLRPVLGVVSRLPGYAVVDSRDEDG
jgi:DNA-binding GntR family transcriptional regulator